MCAPRTLSINAFFFVPSENITRWAGCQLLQLRHHFFQRLPTLQKTPYDPAWKNVNLAAPVPGWRRFEPMQRKLDALAGRRVP